MNRENLCPNDYRYLILQKCETKNKNKNQTEKVNWSKDKVKKLSQSFYSQKTLAGSKKIMLDLLPN